MKSLLDTISGAPGVRGIEIKLSQGAKPGKGGVLPGHKVTDEIAKIRGVRAGEDCISPNSHRAFSDVPSLIRSSRASRRRPGSRSGSSPPSAAPPSGRSSRRR